VAMRRRLLPPAPAPADTMIIFEDLRKFCSTNPPGSFK